MTSIMKLTPRESVKVGNLLSSWKYILTEICIHIFVTVKLKLGNITIILNLKSRIDLMQTSLGVKNILLKKIRGYNHSLLIYLSSKV